MRNRFLFIFLAAISIAACYPSGNNGEQKETREKGTPIDANATRETVNLYSNLFDLLDKGTMFGAQIPTLYGLDNNKHWYAAYGQTDDSDTKFLTGSNPAVCGWEISGIELGNPKNIDGEIWEDIKAHIKAAYRRGAIVTMSWHCANPVTGGTSWDGTKAVNTILDGGVNHEKFLGWMDKAAAFISTLKGDNGEAIPIIFRPWHEHTGSGFWWGMGNCTETEFIKLWQMTVKYMRDTKGLHNLLYAYSPDIHHFWQGNVYMNCWPGDEWVDVLGFDAYDTKSSNFNTKAAGLINYAAHQAKLKKKIFALTETGIENNNPEHSDYYNAKWWTKCLVPAIKGKEVSFVLVWRDGGFPTEGKHYFNAFRGCYSASDFVEFANMDNILLEKDLPDMYGKR